MVTIERTAIIQVPVGNVYAYIANPANLVAIWPCLIHISNIRSTEAGTGTTYDWVYKMGGMHFEGKAEITECVPNERIVVEDRGEIRARRTTRLEPVPLGTRYTTIVEYLIPSELLGKLGSTFIERLNECEADMVLANLKARLESGSLVLSEP